MMGVLDRQLGSDWGAPARRSATSGTSSGDLDPADLWAVHQRAQGHPDGLHSRRGPAAVSRTNGSGPTRWWRPAPCFTPTPSPSGSRVASRPTSAPSDLSAMWTGCSGCSATGGGRSRSSSRARPTRPTTRARKCSRQVYRWTHDPFFEGRVAFLEDYDMHLASALVQGVDLWLNLPRVPLEACGTSGMKAALERGAPAGHHRRMVGGGLRRHQRLGHPVAPPNRRRATDASTTSLTRTTLPASRGRDRPRLLRARCRRHPARLGRPDAKRHAGGRAPLHRPTHGAASTPSSTTSPPCGATGSGTTGHPPRGRRPPPPRRPRAGRLSRSDAPPGGPGIPGPPCSMPGRTGYGRPRRCRVLSLCPERGPGRGGRQPGAPRSRRRGPHPRLPSALPLGPESRPATGSGRRPDRGADRRRRGDRAALPPEATPGPAPRSTSSSTTVSSTGTPLRRRPRATTPTITFATPASPWPRCWPCPRLAPGPVLLHAHDWHAALAILTYAPDHAERSDATPGWPRCCRCITPGTRATIPRRSCRSSGSPWELFNWRHLEWYGKVNLLKAGLVFADAAGDGEPEPRQGAPHRRRRVRPAGRVHARWAPGSRGS